MASENDHIPTDATQGGPRLFSCLSCKHRKIKCDKIDPCTNCTKANSSCVYKAPPPPRRRKRGGPQVDVHTRLKYYEELFNTLGIRAEVVPDADLPAFISSLNLDTSAPDLLTPTSSETRSNLPIAQHVTESGKLIAGGGKSRYINTHLWSRINNEFPDPSNIFDDSESGSDDAASPGLDNGVEAVGLLFDQRMNHRSLHELHPHPSIIIQLWNIYKENVDPITKLLHAPTIEKTIIRSFSSLDTVSKSFTALLFTIYSLAVLSLTPSDCLTQFGEDRTVLLARYRSATKCALVNAKFLRSSDFMVYQAFVLHIISIRPAVDPRTLWHLTGMAVRMGQMLGIHRDGANLLNLSPFEAELRRRIWWHVQIIDHHMGNLSGVGASLTMPKWDTQVPLNINDADIWPEMTEPPQKRTEATDMMFCMVRYEIAAFLHRATLSIDDNFASRNVSISYETLREKDKNLDALEKQIEERYLRYCDPIVPLHLIASSMVRGALCRIRFMNHHPKNYTGSETTIPQSEKDLLFTTSVKMLQGDNLVHSTASTQRFLWHVNNILQWHTFLYLLSELCKRPDGPGVDQAWREIEASFAHHPVLTTNVKLALYKVVGALTLKAWRVRDQHAVAIYGSAARMRPPGFIQTLAEQARQRSAKKNAAANVDVGAGPGAIVGGSTLIGASSDRNISNYTGSQVVVEYPDTNIQQMATDDFLPSEPLPMSWQEIEHLLGDFNQVQHNSPGN